VKIQVAKTGIIWSDRFLDYNLGEGHPMNTKRLIVPYKLLESALFRLSDILVFDQFQPASDDEIQLFHTPDYLKAMKISSKEGGKPQWKFGLGTEDCPIFPGMHESSSLIVGGVLEGVNRILKGDVLQAFCVLGGTHHAFPDRAAGFCYYNDAVIAIKHLQKHVGIERVLYIDTDVHHGDGVLKAFHQDESVLCISIHEHGHFNFPGSGHSDEIGEGKGKGYTINIPLFPGTWDDLYLRTFEQIIPCLWEEFDPEFIIWQCGADGHYDDVLGHFALTTKMYHSLSSRIAELSKNCKANGKLLLLGGGGYNPDSAARIWLTTIAGLSGIKLPLESPPGWVNFCYQNFNLKVSPLLEDTPLDPKSLDGYPFIEEEIEDATKRSLQTLLEAIKNLSMWKKCTD
jgi:acetoin utilization protein AcuC